MSIYWAMFVLPILFGLSPIRVDCDLKKIIFYLFGITLVVLIGLRHEVGGDWERYLVTAYGIERDSDFPGFLMFIKGDYAYRVIHWFSVNYLYGVYGTNTISAIFFVAGLIRFCKIMPLPWISLFVSVPFLIIVVSMGYTRQSIAVGLIMWGLVDLINGRKLPFYTTVVIASFFHVTALLMLSVGFLYGKNNNKFLGFFIFSSLVIGVMYFLFTDQINRMTHFYLEIEYLNSGGAVIRVLLNSLSAVIFFIFRSRFKKAFKDERLWLIFSVVSLFLLPLSFQFSTFSDRIAIYFIPLQLVVLSRIPVLIKDTFNRTIFVFLVVFVYALFLFMWLNLGDFSKYWLPYQNILFTF